MAWARSCVAPRRRTSVSTSFSESCGRASAFVVASFMVAYSSASWACGWSCNNPGYAAFFNHSSTTFDHSSLGSKLEASAKPAFEQWQRALWDTILLTERKHLFGSYLLA